MALLIGVTGGMGSGKSTVARLFRGKGGHVIDADALCRELVEPGRPALQEIAREFGEDYISPDGSLDRKRMAETVFQSPEARERLEGILHPRVFAEEQRLFEEIKSREPEALVILDAALLIESGNYRKVDKVIVVTCEEESQVERIARQGQFSREDIRARLKNQMPLQEKLNYADYIIPNEGSLEQLQGHVDRVFSELQTRSGN